MINLVQQLLNDGVPIDGVGLQGHFIVGEVPTTLQANMEAITALGVEVRLLHFDTRRRCSLGFGIFYHRRSL